MYKRIEHCPSHTRPIFDPARLPEIVDWATFHVIDLGADAIVGCGHSGIVLGGVVAYTTGVPLFAVRKRGEPCVAGRDHDVSAVAPNGKAKRWVWLDDFICSGGTFRHAVKMLWEAELVTTPCPLALLHYRDSETSSWRYVVDSAPDYRDVSLRLVHEIPDFDWNTVPAEVPRFGFMS